MKGSGKAFCSGADVVALYQLLNEGGSPSFVRVSVCFRSPAFEFFRIKVAIMDGITMGCGAGISLPGMFRLVTDKTEQEAAESYNEWCTSALKKLKEASPLSLKVTLQSIREGRFQPLDQCLAREYRMSLNWISKNISND
ncbi:small ribosomal subunit protein mS47-like [Cornus florida]|uniref:small ribosomal subunit protein mS47-like n=1 Tax=Cornus florida TaxID=4283 RepID=UPI0028A0D248|nr:small ribosomal subunit protein mS47-like [Cornus florida]